LSPGLELLRIRPAQARPTPAVNGGMSFSWPQRSFAAGSAGEDIFTPVFEVLLPRGKMVIRLRVSSFPNGSLALEIQDSDGQPFYWPTLPCCPTTLAGLLPEELADASIVAIKPSALRNGMAQSLVDAGLLTDLGMEMPVDRHWVRLMKIEFATAERLAGMMPREAADPAPQRLREMSIPPGWADTVKRIRQVFRRHGKEVSEDEAMLAWAMKTRAINPLPKPLPPSTGAIHELLAPLFEPVDTERDASD
jgi:hypothetical protein